MEKTKEYQDRLKRLESIRQANIEAYPSLSGRNLIIGDFLTNFKKLLKAKKQVVLAGRITSIRSMGGSCFLHFQDESGKLQAFLRKENLEAGQYDFFKNNFDEGDFAEIEGKAFETRTQEPTILVAKIRLLTKTLLPIPNEYYGLKDADLRWRKRYLDLLVNPGIRKSFDLRSQVIKLLREYFDKANFVEVDTPILQSIAGGATAKPFVTHHNALDIDLYLRVAPELYLKRLIIGGYEKVYEVARCFRNEGIDHQHNPEFTQVEFYWAYQDYNGLMDFTEKLLQFVVKKIKGKLQVKHGQEILDFKGPYPRLDFRQALNSALNIDIDKASDQDLAKIAKDANLPVDKTWGRGKLLDELYKKFVRAKIVQPTFIINHPIEISPLAKRLPDRPNYVARFQLVVKSAELCNAFSELNDPLDQKTRFEEQKKLRDRGDEEAQGADSDFVEALMHGMPPTAGWGMGIDRLVMMLANIENIKEIILFPTMRPKDED